jgi:hypothetical protein
MSFKSWFNRKILKGETKPRMFFNLIYWFETGKGRTISRIYSPISELLVLFIFLQQRGFSLSFTKIAVIILLVSVGVILVGRWYVKKDFFKLERSIDNEQNRELMSIKKDVEDIKEILKNGR